jgi:hypothetical protein
MFFTGTLRRTSRVCTTSQTAPSLKLSSAVSVSVPAFGRGRWRRSGLEVEALADFLARLVDGVVDLRHPMVEVTSNE